MKKPASPAAAPAAAPAVEVPAVESATLRLGGTGRAAFWKQARALPTLWLSGEFSDEPFEQATASVVRAGRWLIFGLEATESSSIVARHCTHGMDQWFDDAFVVELSGDRSLTVSVNPLGAICCRRGQRKTMAPIASGAVRAAARIRDGRWRVELAVDLSQILGGEEADRTCRCRVIRQRQPRGLEPFEEIACPPKGTDPLTLKLAAPRKGRKVRLEVAPPQRLADVAVLHAVLLDELPKSDRQWSVLPATPLVGEGGRPVAVEHFQPTEVRAAVAGQHVAIEVRCGEAFADSIVGAPAAVWEADSVEIFLGPEQFNYLQLAVGADGRAQAAWGKPGGRRVRTIPPPKGVVIDVKGPRAGQWAVRVAMPAGVIIDGVGAPADAHPARHPWWVNVVRNRPPRRKLAHAGQLSTLNVTLAGNSHCPARFGLLRPAKPGQAPPAPKARPLRLPEPVLDARRRANTDAASVLSEWIDGRRDALHRQFERRFAEIKDADAWRAFAEAARDSLRKAFFPFTGGKLPETGRLNAKVVYDRPGGGIRCQGVIFESQPGLPVPATLYVPAAKAARGVKRPGLIMIPAHHTGRNSRDLAVLGSNFARAGGVAMAMETIGSGERGVSGLWTHKNYQRCLAHAQAALAGDTLNGWTVVDLWRALDYLLSRGDVDPGRIALVGGVAGGGDVSAASAALDERIGVSIPFNFGFIEPMETWYDPLRSYPGAHAGGLSPWTVCALTAPRRLIQAQEFAWGRREQARYARFERVYSLLKLPANLAKVHGGPNTHATHFSAVHRLPMYRILNRWFGMKLPTRQRDEAAAINPSLLDCFEKPAGREYLAGLRRAGRLRQPHELADRIARARRAKVRDLPGRLAKLLGDVGPVADKQAPEPLGRGAWRGLKVQGVWLAAESGQDKLGLAAWVMLPKGRGRQPAVLCVAQDGKARFLLERGDQVERLLGAGLVVCLLDVRGCGETSPGTSRLPDGASARAAQGLWMLNESLPARRLKDVRTALAYLAGRKDVDAGRLGLWGEGLAEPNGPCDEPILFDEVGFRQTSPTPMRLAEPAGGMLAMLAGLYPVQVGGDRHRVRAVLARGTMVSWSSVLERRHYYVPTDAIVPGLLAVADVPDVARALRKAGVALRVQDLRDGCNRRCDAARVKAVWGDALPAGYAAGATDAAVAALIEALKKK